MKLIIVMFLLAFLIAGCTKNINKTYNYVYDTQTNDYEPIQKSLPIQPIFPVIENTTKYNFLGDYNNFYFLHPINFDMQRAVLIISAINYSYIAGINELIIMHSNRFDYNSNVEGIYYTGLGKIEIYEYGESDNWIIHNILHELKHHYCYIHTGNPEPEHKGCFLNTPIDKEYGFIR